MQIWYPSMQSGAIDVVLLDKGRWECVDIQFHIGIQIVSRKYENSSSILILVLLVFVLVLVHVELYTHRVYMLYPKACRARLFTGKLLTHMS